MPLLPGSLFILFPPRIDDEKIGSRDRIRLYIPGGIAPWFIPADLPHRLPGRTGFPADLFDALLLGGC
jgi:hypothetical protein